MLKLNPDTDPLGARTKRDDGHGRLTLQLSPAAQEKIEAATRESFWTPDSLVEALVNEHLHSAYPAITYRAVPIAPAGTFRTFDKKMFHPALGLLTALGRYRISVRLDNPDYERWVQTYRNRGNAAPEAEAAEMCLFKLKTYLEEWTGESKIIYPDDFLVEQILDTPQAPRP